MSRPGSIRSAWLVWALVSACGGSRRLPASAAQARLVTSPDASTPPAVVVGAMPHREVVVPVGLWRTNETRDHYLAGGFRATGTSLSEEELGARLVSAVETARGWVFLAEDRRVFASDDFLGPLRALGRVRGRDVRMPRMSLGRAVILQAGALYTSDGRALTRAESLRGEVDQAAFTDERHGAVVRVDHTLARTQDGGATWMEVDLGGELALGVVRDTRALMVATTRGLFALADDGGLSPMSWPSYPGGGDDPRVGAMIRERFARSEGQLVWLRGGGRVLLNEEGEFTFIDAAGRMRRGTLGARGECHLIGPWGDGAAVVCDRLFRVTAEGRVMGVDLPVECDFRGWRAFSDDGVHAVFPRARSGGVRREEDDTTTEAESDESQAPPDRAGDAPEASSLCFLEDGSRRVRTVESPTDVRGEGWRTDGMHGTRLLLSTASGDGRTFKVFDVATGAFSDVTTAPAGGRPLSLVSLAWGRDGELVGVAGQCAGACVRVMVSGRFDRPLTARALSRDVDQIAFADPLRGLATSSQGLWRTRDGGTSWERVPVDDGDYTRAELQCGGGGCSVRGAFCIEGWGPFTQEERRPSDEPRPSDDAPPAIVDRTSTERFEFRDELSCEVIGRRTSVRVRRPREYQLYSGLYGHYWARDPSYSQRHFVWRSFDGGGDVPLPLPVAGVDNSGLPEGTSYFHPFWVGRSVLYRLESRGLLWAHGARVDRIQDPSLPQQVTRAQPRWIVRELPGGGLVGLITTDQTFSFTGSHLEVDVMFELDASGAVRARRVFAHPPENLGGPVFLGVAEIGGRWGRVVVAADGAVRFHPLVGEAVNLPAWPSHPSVCVGPTAPDAVTFHARSAAGLPWLERERTRQTQFELSPRGVCVRSTSVVWMGTFPGEVGGRGERPFVARLEATRGGALEGFAEDGERRARIRCAPDTRPTEQPGTPTVSSGAPPGGDFITSQIQMRQQFAAGKVFGN